MDIQQQIKDEVAKRKRKSLHVASMQHVLKYPSGSVKRWRAAYEHFLKQRPDARYEAQAIIEYNKERRTMLTKFADMEFGRLILSAPSFLNDVLRLTDPQYFAEFDQKDLTKPKHLRKLQEAFPEYFMPKEI